MFSFVCWVFNRIFVPKLNTIIHNSMEIKTIKTETIVIKNPSVGLLRFVEEMREHKKQVRDRMRTTEPMFIIKV